MDTQRIAIVGLGRIGSAFLRQISKRPHPSLELVCVAEVQDTPGRRAAQEAGIRICTLDETVALGGNVHVIFELTGLPEVRRELRDKLVASGNTHTIVASESIMRVIWALISDEVLPVIAGRPMGY
ncbi:MAG: homoserine dehydrogenase [Proteobacteria bacterium]|nr:homoserine dehydrogenase [Pseudomonadota bacterium]